MMTMAGCTTAVQSGPEGVDGWGHRAAKDLGFGVQGLGWWTSAEMLVPLYHGACFLLEKSVIDDGTSALTNADCPGK